MSDEKTEKGKAWAKKTKSKKYYENIDRILGSKKAPEESPEAKSDD